MAPTLESAAPAAETACPPSTMPAPAAIPAAPVITGAERAASFAFDMAVADLPAEVVLDGSV